MRGFPKSVVESSLVARFEAQVQCSAERIALRSAGLHWTYRELNVCANRLARQLLSPVDKEPLPILLLLGHSALEIIALLAVLKTGRAYVALDPETPLPRLQQIAADVGSDLVLSRSAFTAVASVLAPRVVTVPAEASLLAAARDPKAASQADGNLHLDIEPSALASLVYTSGSTGTPKGVMRSHRCSLHRYWLFQEAHQVDASDHFSHMYSCGFVASEVDIYGALLNGATLCCCPIRNLGFGQLAEWLAAEKISLLHPPPTLWRRFLASQDQPLSLPSLRAIFLGGEAVYRSDIERIQHLLPGCTVVHRLSSSEASVLARNIIPPGTRCEDEILPAGFPVHDKEILLLDAEGREVPAGETGEIVVQSRYLSPGYWRRPELTAEKFSPVSAAESELALPLIKFRTGDLGRFKVAGGKLFHLGRIDNQVKVAGYRVEPREVETALLCLGLLKEAAVLGMPDGKGEMLLVGMVVPSCPSTWREPEIRRLLAERLPLYMIPAHFVVMPELPTLANGKIDRVRLAAEQFPGLPRPDAEPENLLADIAERKDHEIDAKVAEIWQKVLNLERVGLNDHFFHLGGSSIQAATLADTIEKRFQCRFPLPMIYRAPTIAAQAQLLRNCGDDPASELCQAFKARGERPMFWILCGFIDPEIPVVPFETYLEQSPTRRLDGMSLELLARDYVDRILRMTPEGPYRLGGYSIGGLLAIEAARQLEEQGETVDLLFLVDPKVPGAVATRLTVATRLQRFLQRLLSLGFREQFSYAKRVVLFYLPKPDFGLRQVFCNYLLSRGRQLPVSLRRFYAKRVYREAANTPPRPFLGNTTIYFRKDHPGLNSSSWKRFCPVAEVQSVDTFEHDDIVKEPWKKNWLKDLQEKLRAIDDLGTPYGLPLQSHSSTASGGERPESPF